MRYITRNLPFVEHVALWASSRSASPRRTTRRCGQYANQLSDATHLLVCAGLAVSLYNLSLCALPKDLWPYARQSISGWKNDYLDACAGCSAKARCGGFFSWVTSKWTSRAVHPIKEEVACPAS